jgi:hypothetical protein
MITLILLLAYPLGYMLTLILLHTFKRRLGIDVYDEPQAGYEDDWHSNSEAYAAWSFAWPLLWIIFVVNLVWVSVCLLSAWLDDK